MNLSLILSDNASVFGAASLVVASLTILVTVLIGWQLFNAIIGEKRIVALRNEFISIARMVAEDVDYERSVKECLAIGKEFGDDGFDVDMLITALSYANRIRNDEHDMWGYVLEVLEASCASLRWTRGGKMRILKELSRVPDGAKRNIHRYVLLVSEQPTVPADNVELDLSKE